MRGFRFARSFVTLPYILPTIGKYYSPDCHVVVLKFTNISRARKYRAHTSLNAPYLNMDAGGWLMQNGAVAEKQREWSIQGGFGTCKRKMSIVTSGSQSVTNKTQTVTSLT